MWLFLFLQWPFNQHPFVLLFGPPVKKKFRTKKKVVVVVLPRRVFVEGPAAAGHRPARAATLDPRGVSDKRKILEQAPVEEKEKRWPEEEPEKR